MKFILSIILFILLYCQIPNNKLVETTTNCNKLCEINKSLLFSNSKINYNVSDLMVNGKEVGRYLENGVDIWKVINCCKSVDEEFIEDVISKYCEEQYGALYKKNIRGGEVYGIYGTIPRLLKNLPISTAFEVGMLYFSFNAEGKDYDMDYVGHFSLNLFEHVLIPMLDIKQQKYYQQLHGDMYLEFLISNTQDDSYKAFHKQFFPVFKEDWESGKIKLKNPVNE